MKFSKIKNLADGEFRRLTGTKHKTFDKIQEILKLAKQVKKTSGAKPNKLSIKTDC